MVGGISGSENNGQRNIKLIQEFNQARVSPSGAQRFKKFLSKDSLTSLSLILNLQNREDSIYFTGWSEEK